ncbi:hypothetical protein [Bacillus manliponensis]|uniref:hypothetical protein n=1 Tax=Bacillus manliponensis TaxID=574376 RepID=UPI0035141006
MKLTLVSFFHYAIWAGFSIVLFLSKRDKVHYKILLFFVFLYVAYTIAHIMMRSRKQAITLTACNSLFFFLIKMILFSD